MDARFSRRCRAVLSPRMARISGDCHSEASAGSQARHP